MSKKLFPSEMMIRFAISEKWIPKDEPSINLVFLSKLSNDFKHDSEYEYALKVMKDEYNGKMEMLRQFESLAFAGADFNTCCMSLDIFTTLTDRQVKYLMYLHETAPIYAKGELVESLIKNAHQGCVDSAITLLHLMDGTTNESKKSKECSGKEYRESNSSSRN